MLRPRTVGNSLLPLELRAENLALPIYDSGLSSGLVDHDRKSPLPTKYKIVLNETGFCEDSVNLGGTTNCSSQSK
jgi:hypothetical protein